MRSWLTRTVFILSAVSFLNDMSSELLYPILPLYMASIGFGALWIGILEGVAEAVSGLVKGWFGEWSDRKGERLPFVRTGYLLSVLCKPAIALFSSAVWALLMRTSDRLGKGVRVAARDAMLADESHEGARGKVFGFNRAMDTAGAVVGPCIALWWLSAHRGASYSPLFFYALFPGLAAVSLLFLLREKKRAAEKNGRPYSLLSSFGYWKRSTTEFRKLLTGVLLFTLFNSSDMFLLLLVKSTFKAGITIAGKNFTADMLVVAIYIFYNVVYALFSWPAGWLADKWGMKKVLLAGYVFFTITYAGMAYAASAPAIRFEFVIGAFMIYGLYSACTDGVSKAWISRVCAKEEKGTALGLFAALSSLCTLVASVLAGGLWISAGPLAVFILPALAALCATVFLTFQTHSPAQKTGSQ